MMEPREFFRQDDFLYGRADCREPRGRVLDRILGFRLCGVPERRAAKAEPRRLFQTAEARRSVHEHRGDQFHVVHGARQEADRVQRFGREFDPGGG
jgi:hypothetical protein